MHAIILGIGSDIGCEIAARLCADGWSVVGWHHDDIPDDADPWDLIVCCYGSLEPIRSFWEGNFADWCRAFDANLFTPLSHLRMLYHVRNPGASVCLFSGAGTGGPAPTYSAYAASKAALVKMTELLDNESPDCKFFILGPGITRTKLHEQTLNAGKRAANYQRVVEFGMSTDKGTSHDDIYGCLMACVAAPKGVVGGRNICVHLDDWKNGLLDAREELEADQDMLKLRRHGDKILRR